MVVVSTVFVAVTIVVVMVAVLAIVLVMTLVEVGMWRKEEQKEVALFRLIMLTIALTALHSDGGARAGWGTAATVKTTASRGSTRGGSNMP